MDSVWDTACAVGFPIRKFTDQSLLAAPRDLSQRATSFIASQCQGIHQMPFRRLISTPTKTLAPRAGTSLLASRPTGSAVSAVRCYSQPAIALWAWAGRGASSVTCTSSSLVHDPASYEAHERARSARSCSRCRVVVPSNDPRSWAARLYHRHHLVNGGGRRDRTDDLLLAKQALSQLSYAPKIGRRTIACGVVGQGGFEPPTSRLSSARSNQLSY